MREIQRMDLNHSVLHTVAIAAAGKPLDSEPLLNQRALKDLAVDGDNGIGHDRLQIW